MKLSQYKYIVAVERQDFRSRDPEKHVYSRRGFQTFESAERYVTSLTSLPSVFDVRIINMAHLRASYNVSQYLEDNPRSF